MKLIVQSGHGLYFPLAKAKGSLPVAPTPTVAKLLGVTPKHIMNTAHRYPDRYSEGLTTGESHLVGLSENRSFFEEHREVFGISKLEARLCFWNIREILRFAMMFRSRQSIEVQETMIDALLDDMKSECVSQEKFNQVLARVEALEAEKERLDPYRDVQASCAGKALRAQRSIKELQENN